MKKHLAHRFQMPQVVGFVSIAVLMVGILSFGDANSTFVSPEMRFTDASAHHLQIVPASGESQVPSGCGPGTLNDACPPYVEPNPPVITPVTTDPGTTNPGTTDPGTTNPGGTNPGGTNPGGTNSSSCNQPISGPFTVCGQTATYDPCTGVFVVTGTLDYACLYGGSSSGSGGGTSSGGSTSSGGGSPVPTYEPIPEPPPPPPPPGFVPFTTVGPGPIFNASGHLQGRPTLIRRETVTRLYWNVTNVSSCSVTGSNGDTWSGNSSGTAGATTSPMRTRTVYILHCASLPGSGAPAINETVVINIVPIFNEQ